jgi:N-formylglutamate amidohydrolase
MPVILTCPHGGDKQPPGVPNPRTGVGLPSDCRFETNTDRFTRTITRGVAQALFDVFGEAPHVVIANFDRAFIDANRCESDKCAFEDPDAQPFYDEYHNTIRNFVDEIRADNGGLGLLFDIHGTTQIDHDPADVLRHTQQMCDLQLVKP